MRLVTVAPNPSIDRLYELDRLRLDAVNRVGAGVEPGRLKGVKRLRRAEESREISVAVDDPAAGVDSKSERDTRFVANPAASRRLPVRSGRSSEIEAPAPEHQRQRGMRAAPLSLPYRDQERACEPTLRLRQESGE